MTGVSAEGLSVHWHCLQVMKDGKLGPGVLVGVAMPVISQMIVEGRADESSGHELKESDKDK